MSDFIELVPDNGENTVRIRIGLSWDPKQEKAIRRKAWYGREAYIGNIIFAITWCLSWFVSLISKILTLGKSELLKLPEKQNLMDADLMYETKNRDKAQDDEFAREDRYDEYDVDLYCMAIKSGSKEMVKIGGENHNLLDSSASIVHSGDDNTGQGVFDDEDISINLAEARKIYDEFIVFITSDSKHSFSSYENQPVLRFVQSKEEKDLFRHVLDTQSQEAIDSYGYVFARVIRDNDMWKAILVDKFTEFQQDWPEFLKQYA